MDFENVPDNVLTDIVLTEMDYKTLLRVCSTNKRLYNMCQNDRLWNMKIMRDFPNAGKKPEWMSSFEFYVDVKRYLPKTMELERGSQKPDNLSWREFYYLKFGQEKTRHVELYYSPLLDGISPTVSSESELFQTINTNINRWLVLAAYLKVIPGVTTFKMFLENVADVLESLGSNSNSFILMSGRTTLDNTGSVVLDALTADFICKFGDKVFLTDHVLNIYSNKMWTDPEYRFFVTTLDEKGIPRRLLNFIFSNDPIGGEVSHDLIFQTPIIGI